MTDWNGKKRVILPVAAFANDTNLIGNDNAWQLTCEELIQKVQRNISAIYKVRIVPEYIAGAKSRRVNDTKNAHNTIRGDTIRSGNPSTNLGGLLTTRIHRMGMDPPNSRLPTPYQWKNSTRH
jgi:hypothetical protein